MNRTLRRRIVALESVGVAGCETCRTWYGTVLRDDDGHVSRPEQCPVCTRVVPITCELHIVGVPLDLP